MAPQLVEQLHSTHPQRARENSGSLGPPPSIVVQTPQLVVQGCVEALEEDKLRSYQLGEDREREIARLQNVLKQRDRAMAQTSASEDALEKSNSILEQELKLMRDHEQQLKTQLVDMQVPNLPMKASMLDAFMPLIIVVKCRPCSRVPAEKGRVPRNNGATNVCRIGRTPAGSRQPSTSRRRSSRPSRASYKRP